MKTLKLTGLVPAYGDAFEVLSLYPADKIVGTPGDDSLTGTDQDDTLDGGAGNDTMRGGDGADTYYVDSLGDVVIEYNLQYWVRDKVISSVSYTLDGNVEELRLTGSADLDGTGNAANNLIIGNAGANRLDGAGGFETLRGGDGNDVLYGQGYGDQLYGGSGDDTIHGGGTADWRDTIYGGEGNDQITAVYGTAYGDEGNDTLVGTTGYSHLRGGAGDDHLTVEAGGAMYGGLGNDSLYGSATSNTLDGGGGKDWLAAGAGDDRLHVGMGRDTVDGGSGKDTLIADWSELSTAIVWHYAPDSVQIVDGTRITGTEGLDVDAGSGNDTIDNSGSGTVDNIYGGAGDDLLIGDGPGDYLSGGEGNDTLIADGAGIGYAWYRQDGGAGDDSLQGANVWGSAGNDTLVATSGGAEMLGDSGDDRLYGSDAGDDMWDGSGNDLVLAGGGNDTVLASSGQDTLHGGDGLDYISIQWYGSTTDIVWINDPAQVQTVADKTISGFEILSVRTGSGDDRIDNSALSSNDTMQTGAGQDTLIGGNGNDSLVGGAESDSVLGGAGNDSISGDYLEGASADTYDGGAGMDTFSASWNLAAEDIVWINDPTQTQTVWGRSISGFEVLSVFTGSGNDLLDVGNGVSAGFYAGGGNDTLFGAGGADFLHGDDGSDGLTGKDGNDTLVGDDGFDTLIGGAGADSLQGGLHGDLFVLGDQSAADRIDDFKRAEDKLAIAQSLLSIGDGDTTVEGATTVGGPGGFSASAELVVNTKDIAGDLTDTAKVAAAIGSATSNYAFGQTAIFVVDSTHTSAVYGFLSLGTDAMVSANELTLLCTMKATGGTAVGDYLFVG